MTTKRTVQYTADAVILAPGPAVLLIQRRWDPFEGQWALPGGHLDDGETSLNAAARELTEETGIVVPVDALHEVGVYDAPGRDSRGDFRTTAYAVMLPTAVTPAAADDAAAARWWPVAELPSPLAFDHDEIVADALTRLGLR